MGVISPVVMADDESELEQYGFIEEITVTARKREEVLSHIPLSIAVFSDEGIEARGIEDVYELADFTANFNMNKNNGRQRERPTIRGQSNVLGVPNASFFIDGVYVSNNSVISTTAIDSVERIEVLRGPQAALLGRGTFAGAVNYITKKPTSHSEGEINIRTGSDDEYRVSAWASGPLIGDSLFYFIQAGHSTIGGQWNNSLSGTPTSASFPGAPGGGDQSEFGAEETNDVLARLLFAPSPDFEFNLKVSYSEADDSHYPYIFLGRSDLNCMLPVLSTSTENSPGYYCGEVEVGNRLPEANIPDIENGLTHVSGSSGPGADPGSERQTLRIVGDVSVDVGDWTLFASGAYSHDEHVFAEDSDRTGARASAVVIDKDMKDYAFDLRLTSPQDGRWRGLVGLYYYNQEFVDLRRVLFRPFGTPLSPDSVNNRAVYGMFEYDLLPDLTLSAEGRYAEDEIALRSGPSNTFDSFMPRFTATYDLTDQAVLYGVIAQGNKPGDFNTEYYNASTHPTELAAAIANGRAFVDEEEAWTYEVGTKTRWLDGRATVNVSAYYIDWTNQQLTTTVDILQADSSIASKPILVNLGESEVKGVEVEATLTPNENWAFAFAYGLASTEITQANDPEEAALTGFDDPTLAIGGNLSGKELPKTPKHSFAVYGRYSQTLVDDINWFARTDLTYESKKWAQVHNLARTGDRTKVNVRLGLEHEDWTLGIFVDNAFDDDTPLNIMRYRDFSNGFFGPGVRTGIGASPIWRGFSVTPQPGRRYGLSFEYRF